MKACLFFYTSWAGYLGWQRRRVRTMQNEINELKKQLKPTTVTPEGTPLVPAMQKGNGTARNLHIALNAINVVLSCGRSPLELTWFSKVFEFTKWP
ncbi:hypothetical protein Peur_048242 [Populus x canadensis]